ncbi:NAD(P)/FAD-dependent oxidoreductase [Saccharothrix xinjiangensis]|uniref:Flavin-containing monooxygenase n=1 Tax=Saccharothrix xinjiangensis TaxID=204798 RepID=A0ABV9YF36_9PSEU
MAHPEEPGPGDTEHAGGVEHVDVLIVGAGISGIGAAHYLRTRLPGKSHVVLEARGAIGGTWDLFRYPGVRSDSDLYTLGYEFKPWTSEKSIADAATILDYLRETAVENGIDRRVRTHHRVLAASWSSADARWLVEVERSDTGQRLRMTCGWLFCASGYYDYEEGFTPRFEGRERFRGPVIHPQHWPGDFDHAGKRVLVIGSGATAMTLVPALAGAAAHVTMLQRSPTYVMPVPTVDPVGALLRKVLGVHRAYPLIRRKNIAQQRAIWLFCRRFPGAARRLIRRVNAKQLPEGYPVDEHFRPTYDPWDQRLCAVPDGDLFRAIRGGRASVVTDHVETFTERGVRLVSGRELEADAVVTATGLKLLPMGGIALTVDGRPVTLSDTVAFRGMMLSGVPNFSFAIGYTNASWTLKVGLLCEHFCRLLAHMDAHGHDTCRPDPGDGPMTTRPLLDFGAGYVRRSLDRLPRQGERYPWLMSMSYHGDVGLLRDRPVEDEHLRFSRGRPGTPAPPPRSAPGTRSAPR